MNQGWLHVLCDLIAPIPAGSGIAIVAVGFIVSWSALLPLLITASTTCMNLKVESRETDAQLEMRTHIRDLLLK